MKSYGRRPPRRHADHAQTSLAHEASGSVRSIAADVRRAGAGCRDCAFRRGHVAAASDRHARQQRAAPGDFGRRSGARRLAGRSDAADAATALQPVSDACSGEPGSRHRARAADAPVGTRGGAYACRYRLLLERTRPRARADPDPAERALFLRRCAGQHGRRRMLDLRHLAHAPRAERQRFAAHPHGRRYGRQCRLLEHRQRRPAAYGAARRLAGAFCRSAERSAAGTGIRIGQQPVADELLGAAWARGLPVRRGRDASAPVRGRADDRHLRRRVAIALVRPWRGRGGAAEIRAAAGRVPRARRARSARYSAAQRRRSCRRHHRSVQARGWHARRRLR